MSQTRRTQRIAALIREELATLLSQKISDPALVDIVIVDVDLSPDLKNAKIYFTTRNETVKPAEINRGFQRATPFLKRQLGSRLELRFVPELHFERDEHSQSVDRVMGLLDSLSHGDQINL